ncbi:MAG: hypothetical protein ACJ8CB_21845 [Ktedonobacteraceae bacterium]
MDGQKQHPLPDDFLEQVYRVRKQIIQDSNGELFEDSTEMIRQMREERTEQLMQAVTGQNDEEEESTTTEQIVPDEANTTRQRRPATRRMAEELRQIREEIMKDRNGKLFEDSAELIRREREKRTEHLMQVISGQYGKDPYEEDTLEEQS